LRSVSALLEPATGMVVHREVAEVLLTVHSDRETVSGDLVGLGIDRPAWVMGWAAICPAAYRYETLMGY
jgi:hypothetical protein